MRDGGTGAGGAVAEVPGVGERLGEVVLRGATVEDNGVAGDVGVRTAGGGGDGLGGRRGDGDHGGGGGAAGGTVRDAKPSGVAALRGVDVRWGWAGSRDAVAEVPSIGELAAVGVGGAAAEAEDLTLGDGVRALRRWRSWRWWGQP